MGLLNTGRAARAGWLLEKAGGKKHAADKALGRAEKSLGKTTTTRTSVVAMKGGGVSRKAAKAGLVGGAIYTAGRSTHTGIDQKHTNTELR